MSEPSLAYSLTQWNEYLSIRKTYPTFGHYWARVNKIYYKDKITEDKWKDLVEEGNRYYVPQINK